ncbi:MAG: hypothetical protein JKX97_04185 [Candidatus Lindowbacteria bacterium]|nr:hypothetical protein [Candidatus Lindowbacteria bacterium]
MDESEKNECRRLDPRFEETEADQKKWIKVKIARQFEDQNEFRGLLFDLTPRAIKIVIPNHKGPLPIEKSISTLITFEMPDGEPLTATAVVKRIDTSDDDIGVVLFFEFIRESDRDRIRERCEKYVQSKQPDVS